MKNLYKISGNKQNNYVYAESPKTAVSLVRRRLLNKFGKYHIDEIWLKKEDIWQKIELPNWYIG